MDAVAVVSVDIGALRRSEVGELVGSVQRDHELGDTARALDTCGVDMDQLRALAVWTKGDPATEMSVFFRGPDIGTPQVVRCYQQELGVELGPLWLRNAQGFPAVHADDGGRLILANRNTLIEASEAARDSIPVRLDDVELRGEVSPPLARMVPEVRSAPIWLAASGLGSGFEEFLGREAALAVRSISGQVRTGGGLHGEVTISTDGPSWPAVIERKLDGFKTGSRADLVAAGFPGSLLDSLEARPNGADLEIRFQMSAVAAAGLFMD